MNLRLNFKPLVGGILIVYLIFMTLPFLWLLISSLKTTPEMFSSPFSLPATLRWTDFAGGGPLLDIGVYLAFGLHELLNDHICTVNARAVRTVAPENTVADTNMAWFMTSKGIPGMFAATFSHQECRIVV